MSGQMSLTDLLGKIKNEHKEAYENAAAGKTPQSGWDVDLPIDREYRVRVVDTAYTESKSSGRKQFVITYEVEEPTEFAGAKFQDYQNPNPATTQAAEIFGKYLGAFRASLDGFGPDEYDRFISQLEGQTVVVALRKWGQESDRVGIRWVNLDKGQALSTSVKPPKQRVDSSALRPDINIPKPPETAAQAAPAEAAPAAAPSFPPGAAAPAPGGVNLPPGLRS